MIVFIDTEVNPHTKKVVDYGAVREDGAVLHTHSKTDIDLTPRLRNGNALQ